MSGEPPGRSDNPDRTVRRSRVPAFGAATPGAAAPTAPTTAPASAPRLPLPSAPTAAGATPVGADVTSGTVLSGRYRLEEELGSGGMAVVYAATDLLMPGVRVAIKLLMPELREQPELLNVLRESVRKVRALPHPHIAGVYSVESDGANDFVIMELLQGQTLKALLDSEYARGVPLGMARTLIADVCSALAYAHDHGVIHSDIKPSNIFVTPSGRAKLFDFDIARVLRGPVGYFDARSIAAHTGSYASIESADGGIPDPRDDIYSVACVIYEMLSGWHPYRGSGATEARDKGLSVKPLPSLPKPANRALLQALKLDREERLASIEALQNAFADEKTQRSAVGLRPLTLAAIAVGLLLCVTLAVWFLRSPTGELHQEPTTRVTADETPRRADVPAVPADDPAQPREEVQAADAPTALARSPRVTRLGSTPSQLQEALDLCRQLGFTNLRCSAKELADESPRSVSLQPFAIDAVPVTNADFARFVSATGRRTVAEKEGLLYAPNPAKGWNEVRRGQNWRTLRVAAAARGEAADALPVLGMDLESARAYCAWQGKRLPSEDEWEYSARGREGRVFPWGDAPRPPELLPKHVLPVTAAGDTVAQSRGFGGNVAEWTEAHTKGERVLRGGSWLLPQPYFQRLALRRLETAGAALDSSFRCAVSVESWPGAVEAGAK